MLAASAHVTNAKPAVPGDAASQPGGANAGASADGFNGALAALMAQLGPPPPVTPAATPAPPASDRATAANASGASGGFAPPSPSNAAGIPPASTGVAGGDGVADAIGPPLAGGQDDANSSLQQIVAQTTGQDAAATAAVSQAGDPTAAAQATPLDPRLIQFVAKANAAAAATASNVSTASASATSAPADLAASAQDAAAAPAGAAGQAASAGHASADASANSPGGGAPGASSAALLTLAPASQLTPISVPAPQPGAVPAKSTKAAQIQAAASVATKTLADAAAPASVIARSGVADAAAEAADAPADAAFALPHEDESQASSQGAQASADAPGSGDTQAGPQTVPATPLAATVTAPPATVAMASAHGADITAQLAAQITSRANAPRAAFDFALDPHGLGRVDVTLKIDPQGQLSAVLSFDNPSAAAEAKSRAADLHQALQQAGFDIGQSGLSFTSSGGQGQGAAWQSSAQTSYAQAPVLADSSAEAASPTSSLGASSAGGLDITI